MIENEKLKKKKKKKNKGREAVGHSFPYDADKEDTSDILSSTTEFQFYFISFQMQNTMPEKCFFGHEIFLVDLNKVFFLFFRF